jgi:hypothetical protein
MSDDRVPAPLETIIRAIAGGSSEDNDQRATTFARGLALGALVGAAIAGSTIWQRRHGRSSLGPDGALTESTSTADPGTATSAKASPPQR